MDRIDILWTGGFDSTYRICQLSLMPVEVQPYYISAGKRSEPQELKAMADILAFINGNQAKKCNFLPLQIINLIDIAKNIQVEESFNILRKEFKFGSQFEWFGQFARQSGIKPELGVESYDTGPLNRCIQRYGKIREVSIPLSGGEDTLEYCEFDGSQTSEDLMNVLGPFRFGLPLFRMNKLQTKEAYREMGYEEVIPMTWFCAHPLNGQPCGLCNPCATVMKTGMGSCMPWSARTLYYFFKSNSIGRYMDKKLKAIYNNHWRK